MLIRVALLFLVAMMVMGMVQKWRRQRRLPPPAGLDRLRCATCGRVHPSTPAPRCDRADCGVR